MTDPQLWLSALEIGCFFGLLALSYYLILIGSGFFNFALGPYAMVGGLSASWFIVNLGWPPILAALVGVLLVVAVSAVTELVVVRPVQKKSGRGELPALVAVAAVLFAVQQAAGVAFGRVPLPGVRLVEGSPIELGDVYLFPTSALLIGVTLVAFIGVGLWMSKSTTGRLLRAVGDNGDAARILGLPVSRVRLVSFMLGGLLAGVAGVLFSSKSGISFQAGLGWTLTGFLALVIGGTGRIYAPLIGGLILGIVQVFTPFYFATLGPQTMILFLGVIFFAFKPEGIFVRKVRA
ncbi:branched-chain amino acid ABC transporter permease [Enemella sp. A6]|uniref:branched-chain amino acid ABC transporter permease n=1 Tax=Enemella sp. A6 TaxID=3440152 RepID=UPI003EBCBC3A